jgi:hypothetical protein
VRDAGSHNCDAEDHSGPFGPKDEGTAMVSNVCDYRQSTRRNIPERLNIRGLASSDRHFLSFVRIYIGMYNIPLLVYKQRKTTKPRDKPYSTCEV